MTTLDEVPLGGLLEGVDGPVLIWLRGARETLSMAGSCFPVADEREDDDESLLGVCMPMTVSCLKKAASGPFDENLRGLRLMKPLLLCEDDSPSVMDEDAPEVPSFGICEDA
jgi:hypothetical protein